MPATVVTRRGRAAPIGAGVTLSTCAGACVWGAAEAFSVPPHFVARAPATSRTIRVLRPAALSAGARSAAAPREGVATPAVAPPRSTLVASAAALLAAGCRRQRPGSWLTRRAEGEEKATATAEAPEGPEEKAEAAEEGGKSEEAEGEAGAEEKEAGEAPAETEVEAEASAEAAPPEKKKPEKWTCSSCGAKNFPQVDECHKCGSRKPSQAELSLMEERDAAKAEVSNNLDSFLRLQADLQNYRRQHDESMSRAQELGRQDALRQLVPLAEDITEAVVAPEELAEGDKALFDSYSLLFKKVTDAYSKFGVEVLETEVGEKIDQLKHRKVEEREPEAEEVPGTILEVLKTGWKVDGRVLIPSEVAVVAAPEPEPEEEKEQEEVEEEEEIKPDEGGEEDKEANEGGEEKEMEASKEGGEEAAATAEKDK